MMFEQRIPIFDQMLDRVPSGKLVDLGTGHGVFAEHAMRRGWVVTGVDARDQRFPHTLTAPLVEWIQEDVREHDLSPYDIIACLGLFYHLDVPDQLDLLARCDRKPLILDTHIANGKHQHKLSDLVEVGEYMGRWYSESNTLESSWQNQRSFWPAPDSFHRMLWSNGYKTITAHEPWYLPDRTFFLALP